ncbi:MAG: sugar transferase [Clostridiales bacterium]|nr:sugar transferase [Clostridiales bacterium]
MYRKFGKRILDIFAAAAALLALSPILLIVAALTLAKLGAPVLFTQQRPGRHAKIFRLYKFRSMSNKKDATGALLPDSLRLTPFGRTLRATSLDELPSLLNILKGDMSVVGPRPLLVQYLPYYTAEESRRHDVRPGVTGLAQINGRNTLDWTSRLNFDIQYVDNLSLWLDIKIIAKTVLKVFRRADIVVRDESDMQDLNIERSEKNEIN